MPGHTYFPLSQHELAASASFFDNVLSRRLPSQVKIKALNPHPTLLESSDSHCHCYKKIISTLSILPTTQSRLYFTSSLAKASHHQSSTRHRLTSIVPPHNDTHDDELADPLSLPEQLIDM
jgi:hypothetical protein